MAISRPWHPTRYGSQRARALTVDLDRYLELDFDHWLRQMDYLREFFWSARVAQWAPVAGLVAVLRMRHWPVAALLGGWLGAFLLIKGFSPRADIQANTFWRLLMPAWPAYLLLFASIPLLVPTAARRLGDGLAPRPLPGSARWVGVVAVVTVLIPVVATAAASQLEPPSPPALVQEAGTATILTPVDESSRSRRPRVSPAGPSSTGLSMTSGEPTSSIGSSAWTATARTRSARPSRRSRGVAT